MAKNRREVPVIVVVLLLTVLAALTIRGWTRDYEGAAIEYATSQGYSSIEVVDSSRFATSFRGCGLIRKSYRIIYIKAEDSEGNRVRFGICAGMWSTWPAG